MNFCAGFLKICNIELAFISKVSACFERILFESLFNKNLCPKMCRITGLKFRCVKVENFNFDIRDKCLKFEVFEKKFFLESVFLVTIEWDTW